MRLFGFQIFHWYNKCFLETFSDVIIQLLETRKIVFPIGLVLYKMLYHIIYIVGEWSNTLPFQQHVININELLYVDSMRWYSMYISNNDEDIIYLSQNIEHVVEGVGVVLYGIDSNACLLTSSWKEKRKTNINCCINDIKLVF